MIPKEFNCLPPGAENQIIILKASDNNREERQCEWAKLSDFLLEIYEKEFDE